MEQETTLSLPIIEGLAWDDDNDAHVRRHLDPAVVDDLIASNDWYSFPSTKKEFPHRRLVVGREPGGAMVTAVLEPSARYPGYWRPITGWWSTRTEATRYDRERRRRRG